MEKRADEMAAILALLTLRNRGESWGSIASDITVAGSAAALVNDRFHDGLIPSPESERVLEESRLRVNSWDSSGLSYVTVLDDTYPERLRDIREMPPFLGRGTDSIGDISLLQLAKQIKQGRLV